jgi:transcriptional regulator with XRE-family HTH domain
MRTRPLPHCTMRLRLVGMDSGSIARWLHHARLDAGLSVAQATKKAQLPSIFEIHRLEKGERKPSLRVLARLCAAYGADYAEGLAVLLGERAHGFTAQHVITCRKLRDDPSACARCTAELPMGCPGTCDAVKGYTLCPEGLWRLCPCCASGPSI